MTETKLAAADLKTHAGSWTLDTDRTTVAFHTKAMWVMPVKGTAKAVRGDGQVGEDGTVSGRLVIDAASINTGMAKRDKHLRTADFLDTEANPTIEFELGAVGALGGGRLALEGTLLVHGQRQPVTIDAEVTADGDTATVNGVIDDLDRRRWGLTWAKMGAGVHNKVTVQAVFTRTHPGTAVSL